MCEIAELYMYNRPWSLFAKQDTLKQDDVTSQSRQRVLNCADDNRVWVIYIAVLADWMATLQGTKDADNGTKGIW